jgi:hypothetical protein
VHGVLVERVQKASRVVREVSDRSCHGMEGRQGPGHSILRFEHLIRVAAVR